MDKQAVLVLDRVSQSYHDGALERTVIHSLDLTIYAQECVAIMGRSGSGKSTLLNMLGSLEEPRSGRIHRHYPPHTQARIPGFIFQFHHLLAEFTAIENVALSLIFQGTPRKKALIRAQELLSQIGLEHRMQAFPSACSGGERQRIAIARAFAARPFLVLADEPTGNLDAETAQHCIDWMIRLVRAEQSCCIMVTHDPILAQKMDRLLILEEGRILTDSRPPKGE